MTFNRWQRAQKAEQVYWERVIEDISWLGSKFRELLSGIHLIKPFLEDKYPISALEIGIGPLGLGIINFFKYSDAFCCRTSSAQKTAVSE